MEGVIGRLRRFLPVLPTTLANLEMGPANGLRPICDQAGPKEVSTDCVSQAERKAPISYCKPPTNAATRLLTSVSQVGERKEVRDRRWLSKRDVNGGCSIPPVLPARSKTPQHLRKLIAVLNICSKLHLQLWVKIDRLANGYVSQAHHSLAQVCGRALDCTAFMNQPLDLHIEMKAISAIGTGGEVLPYNGHFLNAEFPINIQMKTSNSFNAIHTFFFHSLLISLKLRTSCLC